MRWSWRDAVVLVAALLAVLGVMWLGDVTGSDLGFALFYLLPVAVDRLRRGHRRRPRGGGGLVEAVRRIGLAYPLAHLGASVGVAAAGASEVDAEGLLRLADAAMYDAKTAGKARVAVRWPEASPEPAVPAAHD